MIIPIFKDANKLRAFIEDEMGGSMKTLLKAKAETIKYADSITYGGYNSSIATTKDMPNHNVIAGGSIMAKIVINTTNILDSHGDVHINGLWDKSLQERKRIYHLQEHVQKFSHVISRDVRAYTELITWEDLGYPYTGQTQALVFDSKISKATNEYMYNMYINNEIDSHSVGMQYVKIVPCVNSEQKYFAEEKGNWDKYIKLVVNPDSAEECGMFFAITEAKAIEGSAVLIPSNMVTPTLEVTEATDKGTSLDKNEPNNITHIYEQLKKINYFTN